MIGKGIALYRSEREAKGCTFGPLQVTDWWLSKYSRAVHVRVPAKMRSNTLDAVVAAAVEGTGLVYAPPGKSASSVLALLDFFVKELAPVDFARVPTFTSLIKCGTQQTPEYNRPRNIEGDFLPPSRNYLIGSARACVQTQRLAAAFLSHSAAVVAAKEPGGHPDPDQPTTLAVPPASGTTSSDLSRSRRL